MTSATLSRYSPPDDDTAADNGGGDNGEGNDDGCCRGSCGTRTADDSKS